jgi:hypothetical protein
LALVTETEAAQVLEGVDAGRVTVLPDERHRVVANRTHVDKASLLRSQAGRAGERAWLPTFSLAVGAGTVPAKVLEVVGAVVAILPGDLDHASLERPADSIGMTLLIAEVWAVSADPWVPRSVRQGKTSRDDAG